MPGMEPMRDHDTADRATEAERDLAIPAAVVQLRRAATMLSERVDLLMHRTEPVRRKTEASPDAVAKLESVVAQTPLSDELMAVYSLIDGIDDRVRYVLDTIEV